MGAEEYPIPAIYLHLVAVMDYMSLRRSDSAQAHLLAARGWTNPEIAAHLNLSANTVKRYLSRAMEKLGVTHRQDLKRYMLQ